LKPHFQYSPNLENLEATALFHQQYGKVDDLRDLAPAMHGRGGRKRERLGRRGRQVGALEVRRVNRVRSGAKVNPLIKVQS